MIGQSYRFQDPKLNSELAKIFDLFNGKISPENLNVQAIADAIARSMRVGSVAAIEQLVTGDAKWRFLNLEHRGDDQYGIYVAHPAGTALSNTWPLVAVFSNDNILEACYIEQTGNGRGLYLKGLNGGYPLVHLQVGAGAARIIDTSVTGCFLSNGGVWTDACTRKGKIFSPLGFDPVSVVRKVKIRRFRYKSAPTEVHIGPTAEQLKALTGTGDGSGASPMDLASIGVLGVQSVLKEIDRLRRLNLRLERRVSKLEARCHSTRPRPPR